MSSRKFEPVAVITMHEFEPAAVGDVALCQHCGRLRDHVRHGKVDGSVAMPGIGGAPTRATTLPDGAVDRKKFPVASGVLDYFPDALVAVAYVSFVGNEQHNPGQPLHWARGKSSDEADTIMRHFLQRGTLDSDGVRHSAKMAWRVLALLQKEIEDEQGGGAR